MKPFPIFRILLMTLIAMQATYPALGQGKIDIAVGAGYPEMVNLGFRFQLGQSQLGLYGGILPGNKEEVFSLGADYYYHFGGSSKLSQRRPWFAKAGVNHLIEESKYDKKTYLFLVPRIGRDFNLSRRIGFTLEVGAFLLLSDSKVEINPRESPCWICDGDLFPGIAPSFAFSVFYRL